MNIREDNKSQARGKWFWNSSQMKLLSDAKWVIMVVNRVGLVQYRFLTN